MEIKALILVGFIVTKIMSFDAFLPQCEGTDYTNYKNCKGFSKNENFTDYVSKKFGDKFGNHDWTRDYNGAFGSKPGKYEGKGTVVNYKDGKLHSTYVGEFLNSELHGKGTYFWPTGGYYTGKFKEGYFHGKGHEVWPNGSMYIGKYKKSMKHGKGVYTYPDGAKFEGNFDKDFAEGKGIYTYPNGTKRNGVFKKGELYEWLD